MLAPAKPDASAQADFGAINPRKRLHAFQLRREHTFRNTASFMTAFHSHVLVWKTTLFAFCNICENVLSENLYYNLANVSCNYLHLCIQFANLKLL